MSTKQFYIWEGIYKNFNKIKSNGNAYNSKIWINKSIETLEKTYNSNSFASKNEGADRFILSEILKSSEFNSKKEIHVLDFGGGVGITYARLLKEEKNKNLKYHIVENKAECKAGRAFFKNREKNIFFHSTLPRLKKVDILYIQSSLQYVHEWKSLLQKLSGYKPQLFIFVDLPAGRIMTFATVQNFYGYRIPYWFFNVSEIKSCMRKLNFKLIKQSKYIAEILGKVQLLPLKNFHKQYRIKHSLNLIYKNISL